MIFINEIDFLAIYFFMVGGSVPLSVWVLSNLDTYRERVKEACDESIVVPLVMVAPLETNT